MDNLILSGPVTVSIICGIAALVITILTVIINMKMSLKIFINNSSKIVDAVKGTSLLSNLERTGVFVPSSCGGRGICGTCKVKLKDDIGPHLPAELRALSKAELEANVHLACQVLVQSSLNIEIPQEFSSIKKYESIVESIRDVTYDIKEVYVRLLNPQTMDFKAGQYAEIQIPPYGAVQTSCRRAFSILTTPSDNKRIGFLIRLVPGGIGTTFIHKFLKTGDKLSLTGPLGDLMLHESDSIMLCIGGGSGMSSVRSIIYDMKNRNLLNKPVWYFFGARAVRDLFYVEEFQALAAENPQFHFIPALSEPLPEDNWKGETGFITDVLKKYLQTEIPADSAKEGYLCGSPGMINACIKVLNSFNVPLDKIYFDKFA